MVDSPNLIHSDDYKFNNSIHSVEEEHKPKLVQETTTDLKLNMLANPVKITFYDNSEPILKEEDSVTSEFSSEDSVKISSSSIKDKESIEEEIKEPIKERQPFIPTPPPLKTQNEIRYRKIELLRIFQELEAKGIKLTTHYSIHSNLDDMEQEYEILRSIQNKRNGVQLYKSFLMNMVGAAEFLNESYNPFDFHLDGWSEHVSLGIDDYDDVLGELYEKYKDSGERLGPEAKLCILLVTSATSYHAAKSMLKNSPGLEEAYRKNPHIVNNIAKSFTQDKPKIREPPEFIPSNDIAGPSPAEFMARMKERTQYTNNQVNEAPQYTTAPPEPISTRTSKVIDSISEIDSTSKRRGRPSKKTMNINI